MRSDIWGELDKQSVVVNLLMLILFFKWFSDSTWFEGFAWKVCQCPTCKAHIGWMFEPKELAAYNPVFPSDKGFYAIILDTVISESCRDYFKIMLLFEMTFLVSDVNSLLIVDKVLRN